MQVAGAEAGPDAAGAGPLAAPPRRPAASRRRQQRASSALWLLCMPVVHSEHVQLPRTYSMMVYPAWADDLLSSSQHVCKHATGSSSHLLPGRPQHTTLSTVQYSLRKLVHSLQCCTSPPHLTQYLLGPDKYPTDAHDNPQCDNTQYLLQAAGVGQQIVVARCTCTAICGSVQ